MSITNWRKLVWCHQMKVSMTTTSLEPPQTRFSQLLTPATIIGRSVTRKVSRWESFWGKNRRPAMRTLSYKLLNIRSIMEISPKNLELVWAPMKKHFQIKTKLGKKDAIIPRSPHIKRPACTNAWFLNIYKMETSRKNIKSKEILTVYTRTVKLLTTGKTTPKRWLGAW